MEKQPFAHTTVAISSSIFNHDPEVFSAINAEAERQQHSIELIASENITSPAVMAAQGSVMTNKYAEGYPTKRYYGGCENADTVESLAIARAKQMFGCNHANVQPHSGAQANQAVFLALLNPGDTFMAMRLDHGGHLTHGAPVNMSALWFNPIFYPVNATTHVIDYDVMAQMAREQKPKLIIAGASAYSRHIDFARMRKIADEIGAILMADVAHYAGLIVGGAYPSPFPHAHVVTTTTHKTLRGPRGGMILTNDDEMAKKIDRAVFPGYQGGPLMHVIAGKAVAFGEALKPEFKTYAANIVRNARAMAGQFLARNIPLITGGTDSHVMIVDLSSFKLTGLKVQRELSALGLNTSRSTIPNDPEKPYITSGIRIGTPAMTTRGMGEAEAKQIANLIADVILALPQGEGELADDVAHRVKQGVRQLTNQFPLSRVWG